MSRKKPETLVINKYLINLMHNISLFVNPVMHFLLWEDIWHSVWPFCDVKITAVDPLWNIKSLKLTEIFVTNQELDCF